MNDDITPNQELTISETEKQLITKLRENPHMAQQIHSIVDEFHREIANGMDADEAESMLIESLQKLGASMMTQWADTTQNQQIDSAREEQNLHKHAKKNSAGTPPSEP